MIKIKHVSIDMIAALNHLFVHLKSDAEVTMHFALQHDAIIVSNMPKTKSIVFTAGGKGEVHTNTYRHYFREEIGQVDLIEKKTFSIKNMPEIEDYLIEIFEI